MTYQRNDTPEPIATGTCPECKEPLAEGEIGHYVAETVSTHGFWTCPNKYDPETGRRKEVVGIIKGPGSRMFSAALMAAMTGLNTK